MKLKITALCKTFRGEEFLEAMVKSIYNYVDHIVFVNSELSWEHELQGNINTEGNTCKIIIENLKEFDTEKKIISLNYDTRNQSEQCMYGFDFIKKNLISDFIMLIDTDEVWDCYNLEQAIKFLNEKNNHDYVYRAKLYTYIKSIYYRVEPIEPMAPVVFVSTHIEDLGKNNRCLKVRPMCQMMYKKNENDIPVFFHHFVYVRKNYQTILEKIRNSNGYEGNKIVNLDEWTESVWKKIPNLLEGKWSDGFHPAIGFQNHWRSIKKVSKEDLPETLIENLNLLEEFT